MDHKLERWQIQFAFCRNHLHMGIQYTRMSKKNIDKNNKIKVLKCLHCFHELCIQRWLLQGPFFTGGIAQCPLCRKTIVSETNLFDRNWFNFACTDMCVKELTPLTTSPIVLSLSWKAGNTWNLDTSLNLKNTQTNIMP